MDAMSAMGMLYFVSIEAATDELVARDLKISSADAVKVNSACRKAVAQLEPTSRAPKKPDVVMALKAQAQKAQATKSTTAGAKAPARDALATQSPLQMALNKLKTSRKSKPRQAVVINEAVWSGSVVTVMGRLKDKFHIVDLDHHYVNMCTSGKSLLVAENLTPSAECR